MIALVEFFGEIMAIAGVVMAGPIWVSHREDMRRK